MISGTISSLACHVAPLWGIRIEFDTRTLNNFLPAFLKVSLINGFLLCFIFGKIEEAGSILQL